MKQYYEEIIIGAGPAGLYAAYLLAKEGRRPLVLEMNPIQVGGISRTESYKGFLVDIGGHRFFSKYDFVNNFWKNILGDEFLTRARISRIFYNGKYYPYPLKAFITFKNLGLKKTISCIFSYIFSNLKFTKKVETLEDWFVKKFGKEIYSMFFKTYTEKIWGIKCSELSSSWADQRIKGMSLIAAALKMLPFKFGTVKSMIEEFKYPRKGPGQLWEKVQEEINQMEGNVLLGQKVVGVKKIGELYQVRYVNSEGIETICSCRNLISSTPLSLLGKIIEDPKRSSQVQNAFNSLKYRSHLLVGLIVEDRDLFKDQWIYIHDSKVKVSRIQNYKNWSPHMSPNDAYTCLGLEYFCNENDSFWNLDDSILKNIALKEIEILGLSKKQFVFDSFVIRQPKAYPIYSDSHEEKIKLIKKYLDINFQNLFCVGRAGLHKYNNQDHSMLTSHLTVKSILEEDVYDAWEVNQDSEYHEEVSEKSLNQYN